MREGKERGRGKVSEYIMDTYTGLDSSIHLYSLLFSVQAPGGVDAAVHAWGEGPRWAEDAAAVGLEVWWCCWCPAEQKVSMSETHNRILMSHTLLIF